MGTLIFFVVLALGLLTLTLAVRGRMRQLEREGVFAREETSGPDEDDNEILAIITAAVAASLATQALRVRRVRFLKATPQTAWSVSGRLSLMASHLISKGK